MKKITIAIDGYSSCGKSTMAKQLASALGYAFVDSGAMYRAITFYFLMNGIALNEPSAVAAALTQIELSFVWNHELQQSDIYLNGQNVSDTIREMSVAAKVSEVAAIAAVRKFAVAQQQQMGVQKGIVMDGRDIGTVVFPDAALKIFVTASIEVRTQRRFEELQQKGTDITIEAVRKNLQERDFIDSTRVESPLRQAEDALLLDNSTLSREEQLQIVLGWARERIAAIE